MLAVGPEYGFGLYVHWPYCAKICPYCDFNVYAAKIRDTAPLLSAICGDIRRHHARMPDHPPLGSIFLGGGTPSLLAPEDMAAIITAAQQTFGLKPDAEITLEANPNDILCSDLAGWKAAGINRLSIGVQSLDDAALSFLGRDHDSASARRAVTLGARLFDNFSIDMIYARPGQTVTDWQTELTAALGLGAPHLSLYELTIEARTAFGKRAERGELVAMQDDDQADLYEATQNICDRAGLPAYEVSNHARAPEYQSRHNHIYWNSGDWIGVGPGAHGRLTIKGERLATEAGRRPADYSAASAPTQMALPPLDIARELLAMGLRPAPGVDLARLGTSNPLQIDEEALQGLSDAGLVVQTGRVIALTAAGRLLADRITGELAP